jgi:peroxiredoxin
MAVGVIAISVAAACSPDTDRFRPLQAGDMVPAFSAPAAASGDTVHMSDLRGQLVLLNVWATWCPPCRDEMPGLQALHERYAGRGLRVVGVSVDSPGAEGAIAGFVAEQGLTFDILHDAGDIVSRQFRTMGVPETFLIGTDGRILHRWIGKFDPLADDVIARIDAALPAAAPGP